MHFTDTITTIDELREVLPEPGGRARAKDIGVIDEHCRDFIARAPFLLIGTAGAAGNCDVSPKGDAPGFVQVLDEHTLLIPDRPGNQRADSLTNLVENPHVGLLFVVPGVDWTLRVNGRATIVRDADVLERSAVNGKRPALGIAVDVEEAFLHCPRCFARSNLWDTNTWMPEDEHPSFAQVIRDHAKIELPLEVVEQGVAA